MQLIGWSGREGYWRQKWTASGKSTLRQWKRIAEHADPELNCKELRLPERSRAKEKNL